MVFYVMFEYFDIGGSCSVMSKHGLSSKQKNDSDKLLYGERVFCAKSGEY